MSQREMWKMLHLLHLYVKPGLKRQDLFKAGVDCQQDTIAPLLQSQAVEERGDELYLSPPTLKLLEMCVVAHRRVMGVDMRVDYPEAFVIMPFSEQWSDDVYKQMI